MTPFTTYALTEGTALQINLKCFNVFLLMKLDNNNVIMFDFRIQIKLKSIFTKHISVIINCDFLLCVPVVARFSLVIF